MANLHETRMGQQFFQNDFPSLVKAVENLSKPAHTAGLCQAIEMAITGEILMNPASCEMDYREIKELTKKVMTNSDIFATLQVEIAQVIRQYNKPAEEIA